jgi:ubiquinone/menaquinone biosynthesis C-methylase UbiE
MSSLSFDRAASFYDDTRKLPDSVSDSVTQAILDRLPPGRPILECGVGTGRIAAPLLKRGVPLVGVDLSKEMMLRLREKVGGAPLAQADVSRLPFPDSVFGALLTIHVLHLVGPWREALREFKRVLAPGGVYLNSQNYRPPDSPNPRMRDYWHQLLDARGHTWRRPGAQNHDELTDELRAIGAQIDEIVVAHWTHSITPRQEIDQITLRTQSDSWDIPDDALAKSVADLRAWAENEFRDLDAPIVVERRFVFDVIRF